MSIMRRSKCPWDSATPSAGGCHHASGILMQRLDHLDDCERNGQHAEPANDHHCASEDSFPLGGHVACPHPVMVRRTPRISCEAVGPVPCLRAHAAAPCVGVPGAAASLVSFMRLFDRRLTREVLQPHALACRQRSTGFTDATQELRVVLQTVLEPVVFGLEAYQDAGRTPMTSDDDLLGRSQPQVPGEVILHFRQCHPARMGCPGCRATLAPRPLRRWRGLRPCLPQRHRTP